MPNKPSTQIRVERPSPEDELRNLLVTQLRAPGGDPTQILELLELAMRTRPWEKNGSTFKAFVTKSYTDGGIGWTIENLRGILQLKHIHENTNSEIKQRMQIVREAVDRELIEPAHRQGKPKPEDLRLSKVTYGDRDDTIARLRRDRPDLAEQVLSGHKSANSAAIEAGFRKRFVKVYPNDLDQTVAALKRHFGPGDLAQIAKNLLLPEGENGL